MDWSTLAARMSARLPSMVADIETLVTCESPSADLAARGRPGALPGRAALVAGLVADLLAKG